MVKWGIKKIVVSLRNSPLSPVRIGPVSIFRLPIFIIALSIFVSSCARRNESPETTILLTSILMKHTTILTLGDSLTHYSDGFGLRGELGDNYHVYHYGIPGSDFVEWRYRLDEGLSVTEGDQPDVIFVPLGTNDGYTAGDSFLNNLKNFHSELRIRSSARVVYFQVPVTRDPTLALRIGKNNRALQQDPPSDHVQILDMQTPFEEFSNPDLLYPPNDPIHPTEYGYELFRIEMKKIL